MDRYIPRDSTNNTCVARNGVEAPRRPHDTGRANLLAVVLHASAVDGHKSALGVGSVLQILALVGTLLQ
jgi:hypothetical protein